MKKTISATAIILFSFFLANAQQAMPNTPGNNQPQKTNAPGSRLLSSGTSLYWNHLNDFEITDSTYNIYIGNHGGDPLHGIKADTAYSMYMAQSTVLSTSPTVNTYNTDDSLITKLVLQQDSPGPYQNYEKTEYTFDANHFRINDTSYKWWKPAGIWRPVVETEYTNNATGHVLVANLYTYETGTGAWQTIPTFRNVMTYNASDDTLSALYLVNNHGVLDSVKRYLYTYNGSGQRTARIMQYWHPVLRTWNNNEEFYYTLNATGTVNTELHLKFSTATNNMDTANLYLYSYDANNNLTENIIQQYDYTTHSFNNVDRHSYTYNTFNQLTSQVKNTWNNSGYWELTEGCEKTIYYYQLFFPVNVAQLPQQGGTLQLYPVPTNNTLNVSINWKEAQPYTLTIADMQGRVNMQSQSSNANETIDVSMLPEGVYNIILKGDKGGAQHGRFSVVR